jgi:hypothetical protein
MGTVVGIGAETIFAVQVDPADRLESSVVVEGGPDLLGLAWPELREFDAFVVAAPLLVVLVGV